MIKLILNRNALVLIITLMTYNGKLWAACDQTLSPGADVGAAVANAANGSTICLNSGSYGSVNFWSIGRTSFVTLMSASGQNAVISPSVGNSDFIRFESLSLTSMLINNGSTNIQIINSRFLPNKPGLAIVSSSQVLVDNVDFTQVNQATWAGRLNLNATTNTTIRNSRFIGVGSDSANVKSGAADGIMLIGQASNNTIGPNNFFSGILQNLCDVANPGSHCDSIQFYGAGTNNVITGNFFDNNSIFIMSPDGVDGVTVTNNVFNGPADNYDWKIQFGSANNIKFEHNTLINTGATFDSKTGNPASTNILAQNNIFKAVGLKTSGGSGCTTNCVFKHNLFGSSSFAVGIDNLIGLPSFVGGSNPISYADFQLTTSSIGYRSALDGTDMGAGYTGTSTTTPPLKLLAPTNLRFASN